MRERAGMSLDQAQDEQWPTSRHARDQPRRDNGGLLIRRSEVLTPMPGRSRLGPSVEGRCLDVSPARSPPPKNGLSDQPGSVAITRTAFPQFRPFGARQGESRAGWQSRGSCCWHGTACKEALFESGGISAGITQMPAVV
jgi:hypothetical protein